MQREENRGKWKIKPGGLGREIAEIFVELWGWRGVSVKNRGNMVFMVTGGEKRFIFSDQ